MGTVGHVRRAKKGEEGRGEGRGTGRSSRCWYSDAMPKEEITRALRFLKKDKRLAPIIAAYPKPEYKRGRNAFQSLARAIVYQQISGKAAETILHRFCTIYGTRFPKPEDVLNTSDTTLRAAGVSAQKASYIKDLAKKCLDGTIEPKKFSGMSDEEIREHVVAVKGIGVWTADMFLMFTLGRPDVLPTGDLGIQKGMQRLCKLRALPSPEKMRTLAEPWKPYRTVACWYLWRLADENNNSR